VGEEVDSMAWDGDWRAWSCARWMEGTSEDCSELLLTCVRPQSTQHPGHPRRTPRFPSPMATIHDLPLETIGRIIAIAYSAAPANWKERKERNGFLKATSLVCREWTPFAQEELWIDVSLISTEIQRFVDAGAGRYPTLRLSFYSGGIGMDPSLEVMLRDVQGLRELKLDRCALSMDWLCGDNLKGTRTRHFPVEADS
jgi:hypothetical protein